MWRLASEGGLVAAPEIIWWRLEHPPHGLRERNAVQVYIEAAGLECQGRLLASDDVTAYVSAVAAQRKAGEIVVFVTGDAPMKQVVGGLNRLRKVPVPQITVHYRTHQPGFRY